MLRLAIKGVRQSSLHPITNIYIVAPGKSTKLRQLAKATKSKFVAEETVLHFDKKIINYTAGSENRNGWIFKMLLNLSADTVCSEEHILILDADTVFIAPQIFVYKHKPLFNLSDEYHEPYFQADEQLLGVKHKLSRSYITHYMLFNAGVLKSLRQSLAEKHGCDWYEAIIKHIVRESASGFADYEVYGDYYHERLGLPSILNYWSNISMEIDSYKDIDAIIESAQGKYRSVSLHNYKRN